VSEDDLDDDFALRLVAEHLMRALDLRRECFHDVLAEVRQERELVLAWVRHTKHLAA
jgi:hypothetical protein